MKRAREVDTHPSTHLFLPRETEIWLPMEIWCEEVAPRTTSVGEYVSLSQTCVSLFLALGQLVSVVEHLLRVEPAAVRVRAQRCIRGATLFPPHRWRQLTSRSEADFVQDVVENHILPLPICHLNGSYTLAPIYIAGGYARGRVLAACRAAGVTRIPASLSEEAADLDLWTDAEHVQIEKAHTIAPLLHSLLLHRPGGIPWDSLVGEPRRWDIPREDSSLGLPVQVIALHRDWHLRKCGLLGRFCSTGKCLWHHREGDDHQMNCVAERNHVTLRPGPIVIECFDMPASSVAFSPRDGTVWMTPLAAYAMLTGKCVVADSCPRHLCPFDRSDANKFVRDDETEDYTIRWRDYHIYRTAEWRLMIRVQKYARLGYTIMGRGLACTQEEEGEASTPLPLTWPDDGGDMATSLDALLTIGIDAVNNRAGGSFRPVAPDMTTY